MTHIQNSKSEHLNMTQKLNKWLSDRSITEVECLVPDIAGIPRLSLIHI